MPDALDFITRILRAGHSLATGFQMAGEELPGPLGPEFSRCYAQHSLGQPLEEALKDMAVHVDVSDFSFVVTAVLIQRQTGGDLAEVLKNISGMVRARIRLQQHVKAITAEGRLVGTILLALPFIFFFLLYLVNRSYAEVLIKYPEGRMLLAAGVFLQIMGLVTIRRIVTVKM
jgi:tight adherence protein B